MAMREYMMGTICLILFGTLAAAAFVFFQNDLTVGSLLSTYLPVDFSYVLITVVSLLCIEWLTRKLLKLA